MKKTFLFACISISLSISCTDPQKESGALSAIDIEGALENLTAFKVSDFGKTIRYVPLETTDDCLVGRDPNVKVLRDYIIVEANKQCLLFDKKDGRFIAEIGHIGQDPEAFSSASGMTDEGEEFLYFGRAPDNLIKYDMKGNFCGSMALDPLPLASCFLLTDSVIVGYYNLLNQFGNITLSFSDRKGALLDTMSFPNAKTTASADNIMNISVFTESDLYGNWSKKGAVVIDYKDDKKCILNLEAKTLWRSNGDIRFKESFVDTIYSVRNRELIPSMIFHTGKWQWPEEERTSKAHTGERIFVAYVSENSTFVFFQCIKGFYADKPVLYNGLYHKKTGETRLALSSNAIRDDLTDFMPFKPFSIGTSGEFVSYVEAGTIQDWLEDHPEAMHNDRLAFLKEFEEDMNPVIILVE
ncbi:MAG: DUF4934 domain-containing protein [Tannerella sp.]|jgi:hypothetical protein|nr:DUF4934 domain-containing protein [Tannerella sp.]